MAEGGFFDNFFNLDIIVYILCGLYFLLVVVACVQLIRIHVRAPELGWATQKLFLLLTLLSSLGKDSEFPIIHRNAHFSTVNSHRNMFSTYKWYIYSFLSPFGHLTKYAQCVVYSLHWCLGFTVIFSWSTSRTTLSSQYSILFRAYSSSPLTHSWSCSGTQIPVTSPLIL